MRSKSYTPAAKARAEQSPPTLRALLAQDPMTFNELLDLFEGYVSTIAGPLFEATERIRNELDYHEGPIFGHITGVGSDSHDMAERLGQIRAARNTGTDVTLTLTGSEALLLGAAIAETGDKVSDAAAAFDLLRNMIEGIETDEGFRMSAVMSLAHRALRDVEEQEGETLRRFAVRLGESVKYQHIGQEASA